MLERWLAARDDTWRAQVLTASLDPFRGYANALNLTAGLPAARRVLDPFPVVRLDLDAVDQVRRRVQQDIHGHRGRSGTRSTPICRVLRRRRDRLSERAWQRLHLGLAGGDPAGQVACAWSIAQDLMGRYQHSNPALARDAADRLITDARACPIPRSPGSGARCAPGGPSSLAHFDHPDISNGPTESLNLKIKNTKRKARGISKLRELPAPCVAQPRPHPTRSLDITDPNPSPQVRGIEGPNHPKWPCRFRTASLSR